MGEKALLAKGLRMIGKGVMTIADGIDPKKVSKKQLEANRANLEVKKAKVVTKPLVLEVQIFEGIQDVKLKTQESWVKAYEDKDWIQRELHKANAWIEENPAKRPRSRPGRFYTNWLSRGWETHRKSLPSKSGGSNSYNERMLNKYEGWFGNE